jgi:hypothetical protein
MANTEAGGRGKACELKITYEDENVSEETVWQPGNGQECVVVVEGHL